MSKLIECVPNFSEGRDPEIIRQITDAILGLSYESQFAGEGYPTFRLDLTRSG